MKQLSYQTLKELGYTGYLLENAPEKVLQFGEGNFLRAFVEHWIDWANERAGWNGKVVAVQPIPQGLAKTINRQEGLYTLYLCGARQGKPVDEKRVISAISRCINPYEENGWEEVLDVARSEALEYIVSNTTEAGIVYQYQPRGACPPESFPAKLTEVLYARYEAGLPGVAVLSCELIDHNGEELRRCVLRHADDWALGDEFLQWMAREVLFCSTLVDRIVPGRVRDDALLAQMTKENGYQDDLLDVGECFGVWMIEGPETLKNRLPFAQAGAPVSVVPDITPYKLRKVRILNGAHTGFVLAAFLAGFEIVRDCMYDETVRGFMDRMLQQEIIPTLPPECLEAKEFAASVADRFANPFVDHQLLSIALNSTSKFRARNLPSLLAYRETTGKVPPCLATALAGYLAFYSQKPVRREVDRLIVERPGGGTYPVCDDAAVLDFYEAHAGASAETLVHDALTNELFWGEDLTKVPGLEEAVLTSYGIFETNGALAALQAALGQGDAG